MVGLGLGLGLGPRDARAGSVDIRGQTIRFVNYTNWIGKGEYDAFKAATGCEVREVPINEGRSERVATDPTSTDMILDPTGSLGLLEAASLLAPLNLANIPNYALIRDSFKQDVASPQQSKAVPTDYGRTGILYRTDLVTEPMESWADFWKAAPKHSGKVVIPDGPPEVLRNTLLMLGLNGSSHDEAEVGRAADAVIELKKYVGYFGSVDVVKRLLEGSAAMAHCEDWQGSSAVRENPTKLRWVDPKEGAAGYLDCIAAINKSEVVPAIEQFLNFHLEPKIAANFCNTLSAAPIEQASEQYVDATIKNDPITNPPPEVLNRIVYWSYLGEAQRYWDDAWTRVKAA